MGKRFFKFVNITAGQQFLGTEFAAAPDGGKRLRVVEILVLTGAEAKGMFIEKVYSQGGATRRSVLHTLAASALTDYVYKDGLFGASPAVLNLATPTELMAGEQVQVRTTGLTAAAFARIQYEEVDDAEERTPNLRY